MTRLPFKKRCLTVLMALLCLGVLILYPDDVFARARVLCLRGNCASPVIAYGVIVAGAFCLLGTLYRPLGNFLLGEDSKSSFWRRVMLPGTGVVAVVGGVFLLALA